jgi:hypothetical protein
MTGVLSCSACHRDFSEDALRDFSGTPVCVDCYREMGLLTLMELDADDAPPLWRRLLSAHDGFLPAGPRRRFMAVERFASRMARGEAEGVLATGVRASGATGLQEALWMLIAADALARSGGRNGQDPADERSLAMLLSLSARAGMDISYAAMLDSGVATRGVNEVGDEWEYTEVVTGEGAVTPPQRLARERDAFKRYTRHVKEKADLLAQDIADRHEDLAVPAELLARASDQVLAALDLMDGKGSG